MSSSQFSSSELLKSGDQDVQVGACEAFTRQLKEASASQLVIDQQFQNKSKNQLPL